jgi:hypothetical protein
MSACGALCASSRLRLVFLVALLALILLDLFYRFSFAISAFGFGTSWTLIGGAESGRRAPHNASMPCAEIERDWCAIVDYYATHPEAAPVEMVFANPQSWFNQVRSDAA